MKNKIILSESELVSLIKKIIKEADGEVRTMSNTDPYEYQVQNGIWFTRKKGSQKWVSLDNPKYQGSLDKLNKKFPNDKGNVTAKGKTDQTTTTNKKSTDKDWEKFPCMKGKERYDNPDYGVMYKWTIGNDTWRFFSNGRYTKDGSNVMSNWSCQGSDISYS